MWTNLSFGWNESTFIYHTLSKARAQYVRSKGIPALAYIDDSWMGTPSEFTPCPVRMQCLGAARALRFAAEIAYLCGYYSCTSKCDFTPTRTLRYLGIICDSSPAFFRIPQAKFDKLRALLREALDAQSVALATLKTIVLKCISMKVAVQPASLWTHLMYDASHRFHTLP